MNIIFSQKTKKILVSCLILFFSIMAFQAVLAEDYGLEATAGPSNLNAGEKDISQTIGSMIGAALSFIGVIFFILMIYAGFLWMTARGNEEKVGQAISILMQASIGLIIVAGAYLITRYVGETVIGAFLK